MYPSGISASLSMFMALGKQSLEACYSLTYGFSLLSRDRNQLSSPSDLEVANKGLIRLALAALTL